MTYWPTPMLISTQSTMKGPLLVGTSWWESPHLSAPLSALCAPGVGPTQISNGESHTWYCGEFPRLYTTTWPMYLSGSTRNASHGSVEVWVWQRVARLSSAQYLAALPLFFTELICGL